MDTAAADIVIFGGGIAGLWLLNRLRQSGYSCILFESNTLGGGQTYKSQGIIHGGMKYALQGKITGEVSSLSNMPSAWLACLEGQGEIDLREVGVLSDEQYLFAPDKFTAKLTGLFASATLTSRVTPLKNENYPQVFKSSQFKGQIYALDEIVLDVPQLIRELVKPNQDVIFKIEPFTTDNLEFDEKGHVRCATVYNTGHATKIYAGQFIFAAGVGNEMIAEALSESTIKMQRRPLHMVLVKTPFHQPLYAHCLGLGNRPRVTITTHYGLDGSPYWYIGGALAEEGINKDSHSQIEAARLELKALFPWLDFSNAEFATFMVDRAEVFQKNSLKPDTAFIKTIGNSIIVWPTKLALAPKIGHDVIHHLQAIHFEHTCFDTRNLRSYPLPPLSRPIWEDMFCKDVA